jgi:hypothetical protein
MPATPARIAFIRQAYRSVVKSDSGIRTRYGKAARDTQDQPMVTFFEDIADVDQAATDRFALLKADRRRFEIVVAELLDFSGGLDLSQVTPACTVIDDEKAAAGLTCIITTIEALDFETDQTRVTAWG